VPIKAIGVHRKSFRIRPLQSHGLGDVITVKLMEAAPVTGGMRFELADGGAIPARTHRPPKPGKTGRDREKRRFKPKKR